MSYTSRAKSIVDLVLTRVQVLDLNITVFILFEPQSDTCYVAVLITSVYQVGDILVVDNEPVSNHLKG